MANSEENINNDLEDVGARLKKLNARVRSLSSGRTAGEAKPSQRSIEDVKELSVEQMREKLRTINQYLRRKLSDDATPVSTSPPPLEPII